MARLVSEREETSIRLLTLEMSEGEVVTYALAMKHLLEHLEPHTVEKITGAYRDEVEGMLEDLLDLIDLTAWEAEIAALAEEPAL